MQVGLILVSGSVVALVASCIFQAAVMFLILLGTALTTYGLVDLFVTPFYRKKGRKRREKLREWSAVEQKTIRPRFLFTSKRKVALLPHREAQKLIQLIPRDFVMSWFKRMSADDEIAARLLLEHIAIKLNVRFQKIDISNKLHPAYVPFIDPYLMAFNDAGCVNGRSQAQFDVNHPYRLMLFENKTSVCHHPTLCKDEGEIEHTHCLVDLFIQCAVPGQ